MRWRVWALAPTLDQLMARWKLSCSAKKDLNEWTPLTQVQDMPMEGDFMGDGDMPQPPQDNNQVKYLSHRNFSNICETALTFLFSGCGLVWHGPLDYAPVSKTSNVGLGKTLFISYLSNQWKGLRLNFSPEKSSSEPFLYRFSLQLLSWYMNVPNLWTDSLVEFPWNCLNFFGILQVEYSVICC